ncbi:S-layer homology domain-containing protein [Candidatus Peregrinibacteria bacterium]|nr:S-layer homology domain-containing protein [Candidatus Peregrinibacteria bacterium]
MKKNVFLSVLVFCFSSTVVFAIASTIYSDSADVDTMTLNAAFTAEGHLKLTWENPSEPAMDFYELIKSNSDSTPDNLNNGDAAVLLNSDNQTPAIIEGKPGYKDTNPYQGISFYTLCVYTSSETRGCGNIAALYGRKSLVLQPEVDAFDDVNGHWAENYIEKLRYKNVVKGSNGQYEPERNVTRAEAIKIIMLSFDMGGTSCHPEYFEDMGAGDWFCDIASKAKELNFITGENGSLFPNRDITRAEAVKVILMVKGVDIPEITVSPFNDVPFETWYAKYVAKAKELNIVSGVADNNFEPARSITRAELAKIVILAADL